MRNPKEYNQQWYQANKAKHNAKIQQWRRDNPERYKDMLEKASSRKRNAVLKKKYGIDSSGYQVMYEAQQGICAICHKSPEKWLCIDHDHDTGIVRGLLCSKCNTAIGLLGDSWTTAKSAVDYLWQHKRTTTTP